ncbi:MAG: hypothetical protein H0U73_10540 [Tatlockia sp.]|nr:hypothetical protein [Tatlockia sp.]
MKKLIIAALVFVPATLLTTSCSVRTATYTPHNDYVYSVGNYGHRPYWGSDVYTGGWGNTGYWRGYRGVSTTGVFLSGGRGWGGGHGWGGGRSWGGWRI